MRQVRKANGVFLLGQLLMHELGAEHADGADGSPEEGSTPHRISRRKGLPNAAPAASEPAQASSPEEISAHVLRTLRFVFSTERNRKIFRRLFPPELFAAFIDVGHFVRDIER